MHSTFEDTCFTPPVFGCANAELLLHAAAHARASAGAGQDGAVFDVRYSNVPNQIEPLWGIRFAFPARLEDHVGWWWHRRVSDGQRQAYTDLLRGVGCEAL